MSKLRVSTAISIAVIITLLPFQELVAPAAALDVSLDATELEALPSDSAQPIVPTFPIGDFDDPPTGSLESQLSGSVSSFDPATSVLEEQTARADIFKNVDGSRTAAIRSRAVNAKGKDGKWRKIDPTLRADKSGRINADLGEIQASFAGSSSDDDTVVISHDGASISMSPKQKTLGKSARPNRNSLVYNGMFEGADLVYETSTDRIKEKIVLDEAPKSGKVTYEFRYTVKGFDVARGTDGTILFSKNRQLVLSMPQGVAFDAKGERSPVRVDLKGDTLTLTPDAAWLQEPGRAYPVVVDPDHVIEIGRVTGDVDAYVHSQLPNANFDGNNQIDQNSYVNKVGFDIPGREHYTYLKLDIAPIMNKQIRNARLETWTFSVSDPSDFMVVHPVAQSWNGNQVTWNTRPNHFGVGEYIDPVPNQWTQTDITDWVQAWSDGTWVNHGLSSTRQAKTATSASVLLRCPTTTRTL